MRNLKRALSLALAAVMVIGMMVVGAGAASYNDFTDKDEIKNADAVSMVTELGIINGLPNGTFGPTQNIDRASFVKMLCLAYNGGNEPILPANNKVSYVDTAGTWAAQYIEYCTNLNFVAGDGTTGKFNPTNPVTVSQAAKMLLTALGYSASTEGYVGYDWQMNVDTAANSNHLYDGLSNRDTSSNLTRDDAAQMIYNALNADMVKYEGVWDPSANTIKPQLTSLEKTMLEDKFKAVKVEGIVVANEYADLEEGGSLGAGKTTVLVTNETYTNDKGEGVSVTFKTSTDLNALGKAVTLYVKQGNSTNTEKATVLGSVIVDNDNTVVTTNAKKASDKLVSLLKDEGLKVDGNTLYSVNYGKAVKGDIDDKSNPAGAQYIFIDNDNDGKVEYAIQFVKTFGKVSVHSDKGDGTLTVKLINNNTGLATFTSTDAIDDVKGFEDVAKDDYVLCYKIDDAMHIEKAESVSVTVTSVKGDKITADGKTYEQSGLVTGVNDASDGGDKLSVALADSIGDEVVLYLDAAGYVAYVTDAETSSNYLYVLTSDTYKSFSDSIQAKIVLSDGTKITADIDTAILGKNPVNGKTEVPTGAYTYTVNSKGVYKLTAIDGDKKVAIDEVKKGVAALYKSDVRTGAVANSKTVFVLANSTGGSFSAYTGISNVPSAKLEDDGKGVAVVDKNGLAKVVFITKSTLTGSDQTIYVLDKNPSITVDKNGDKVYTYDVIYKGEKTTLTGDPALFTKTGLWDKVQVSGSEIVDADKAVLLSQGAAALTAGNDLVEADDGKGAYTYNKDTVFLIVDDTDVSEGSIDAITIKDDDPKNYDNIIIVEGDDAGIASYVYIVK